ncbi:GumC family protein [Devosia sp.]|uniref:GumC family protein n=1 Tax=Devosia sp. TaxID=1871048 RepID=UPI002AFF3211|nr:GumC family protein [Devosia sp.]
MLVLRRFWLGIALMLAAILGLAYLGLGSVPRVYEASATILVEPRQQGGEGGFGGVVDGPRIASLVQLLRSRDTLALVVERERLDRIDEFSGGHAGDRATEAAIDRLADQVLVVAGKGNAMIYVRARAQNGELAQQVTLAVAQAGLDRRAGMLTGDIAQAAGWLEGAVTQLRAGAEAADRAVADFRARHGLVAVAGAVPLEELSMGDLDARIQAARERSLLQATRARLWRDWQAVGNPALHSILADGRDGGLLQDYSSAQAELASLSSRMGPGHPLARAADEHVKELQRQLAAAAETAIREAEAHAAADDALARALEGERAQARAGLATRIGDSPELDALQREAAAKRAVLADYLARYQSAISVQAAGTILPDMRIISHPMTPLDPIAPRKSLILGALAIVLVMAILAAAIIALQSGWKGLTAPAAS